jgi:hypothetical protein
MFLPCDYTTAATAIPKGVEAAISFYRQDVHHADFWDCAFCLGG